LQAKAAAEAIYRGVALTDATFCAAPNDATRMIAMAGAIPPTVEAPHNITINELNISSETQWQRHAASNAAASSS
jgi:hypothetical protein